MRRTFILLAAALLVGCGGNSVSSSTSTVPTSTAGSTVPANRSTTTIAASPAKAAFISKGNAVCGSMNNQLDSLTSPGTDPTSEADYLTQSSAISASALKQLRALTVPPGDEAKLAALFQQIDGIQIRVGQLIAALRSGDQTTAGTLTNDLRTLSLAVNQAFTDYGLTVCGS